ncbi:septum formation initiator family protein [bacterium]|nr:MAG: septum formation initiator family protein [bacterium]QQR61901.1 MAG: septum formation initiator family protein [bacterium]QQR62513.1 MAG: septum formation initiator family protein [bacterium]
MQSSIKNTLNNILLLILTCIFCYIIVYGTSGIRLLQILSDAEKASKDEIIEKQQQMAYLQNQLTLWKDNPFLYEKVAREQLHMAKKQDIVYYDLSLEKTVS